MKAQWLGMALVIMATQVGAQDPRDPQGPQGRPDRGEPGAEGERPRVGGGPMGGEPVDVVQWLLNRPGAAERLEVTPEKLEQIRAIREASAVTMKESAHAIQELREKVRLAMQADEVDEAALMTDIRKLGFLETEMGMTRARNMLRIREIIGPEHMQKARERLQQEIEHRRREMRERWLQQRRGDGEGRPGGARTSAEGEGESVRPPRPGAGTRPSGGPPPAGGREAPWRKDGPQAGPDGAL